MDINTLIGQHFILGFQGHEVAENNPIYADITQRNLGGVILFDKFLFGNKNLNNIHSPDQLRNLCQGLQSATTQKLLITVDQEGGKVCRLKEKHGFPAMPSAEVMGRDKDYKLTYEVARQTGELLAELGINCDFAPVADVNINSVNPVIGSLGRSFSSVPKRVAMHCMAWLDGLQDHGVLGCMKHFPGHGSSMLDSHHGCVDISKSWQEKELHPYKHIIPTGKAKAIMMGHLFLHQFDKKYPASLSRIMILELLRKRLKFNGLVITDDLQMRGITIKYGLLEAVVHALAAGADLIIIGNNLDYDPDILEKAISRIKTAMAKGIISEESLHQSYQRIIALKDTFNEKS